MITIIKESVQIFAKNLHFANFFFYEFSRRFIFTKQTRYGIKKKSDGP